MKPILYYTVALIAFAVISQDASAGPRARERARNVRQDQRMKQGLQSGEVTGGEAQRILKRQNKIKHDEAAARADGRVTASEAAKIEREQDRASKQIYRLKHNGNEQRRTK